MPRGDFNIYFASNRRGYIRAEEWVYLIYVTQASMHQLKTNDLDCNLSHRAVGIVLLLVILAAVFVLSCWYFKKRSGYKLIRVSRSHLPLVT